ncbi:uncharacterized protein BO97DRAFT_409281 [Aspergillus homomorphus CBS 101889]|uniref:mRNA stability protein n=1 Tax=Aspergillus homomorphus (strain CBS 101889) TaxID=1450537 RepID=A0A395HHN2_ASPHC|nr:hypothetical protein BO97DRAFT_409281 [Aspergillus homomorphus CBS 101889]RAL07013.1 hypothetical protein BO97DRAFT_409281 [Aspergillus homomorphus CBS 101889]
MGKRSSPYTHEEPLSEREQRILTKYKSQTLGDLRRYKSRERTYFDSGDLALSEANRVTDEGILQTGTAHPSRQTISRPHAPVPEGSNVDNRANEEVLRRVSPGREIYKSHLNQKAIINDHPGQK